MNKAEDPVISHDHAAEIGFLENEAGLPALEPTVVPSPALQSTKQVPVLYKLTLNRLFWVFMIGSFLGVVVEMLWCLATRHYIESRQGLIYGWFNLVYGFGAAVMTLGLQWLAKRRDLWIFLGGFLIGSLFEYFCSWMQEIMFGTVSWRYDDLPFNLNGRINLLYSMFWGLLALIWVKTLYPLLCFLVDKIPKKINLILVWVLTLFMIFNTVVSGAAVERMAQRRDGLAASNNIEVFLDQHYPDSRLQKIFPNMVFTDD